MKVNIVLCLFMTLLSKNIVYMYDINSNNEYSNLLLNKFRRNYDNNSNIKQTSNFNIIDNNNELVNLIQHKEKIKNFQNIQNQEIKQVNPIISSSLTSLTIEAGKLDESAFRFGSSSDFFSFAYKGKTSDFIMSYQQKPIISFNKNDETMIYTNNLKAESALSFQGSFKIRNIPQWILLYDEDFSKTVQGWNIIETTQCGGITMLGGYGTLSKQNIFKKFENLPNHTSLKVQFNYHFIDAWDQESGYMKANIRTGTGEYEYLWIENYSAFMGDLGVNVCGGKWPEGKFSVPVEVTFPHQSSSVSLLFGSTLIKEDPFNASFGISSLRIYFK